jgi:hypothetical protein
VLNERVSLRVSVRVWGGLKKELMEMAFDELAHLVAPHAHKHEWVGTAPQYASTICIVLLRQPALQPRVRCMSVVVSSRR